MRIQSTKRWLAVALSLGVGGTRGSGQPAVKFSDLSFTTFGNRTDGLPIFVLPSEDIVIPKTFHWSSTSGKLRIEQVNLYVDGITDLIGKGDVPDQENENGGGNGNGASPSMGAPTPDPATSTAVENSATSWMPFLPPTRTTTPLSDPPNGGIQVGLPARRALRQNIPLTVSSDLAGTGGSVTINDVRQLRSYHGKPLYFGVVWPNNTGESFSSAFAVAENETERDSLAGVSTYTNPKLFPDKINPTVPPNLENPPPTAAPNPTGQGIAPNEGGLATGAIIGIAVACGVFGLLLIGAGIWFLIRRRNRQAANNHLGSPGRPYGVDRARTEDLIAEKEASAGGADPSPHSPYSDDGVVLVPAGTGASGPYHHEGSPVAPAGVGAVAAPVLSHHHQARSYTPYSDHGSGVGANGSPSIHAASIVHSTHEGETSRAGMGSPTAGRATPHSSLSPRYAHLVEEGMTEDEIRRLEDEERQLDAAIEQARGTR
ncbi:hypothetical protein V8F06_002318 [Rhypophila decipiens]